MLSVRRRACSVTALIFTVFLAIFCIFVPNTAKATTLFNLDIDKNGKYDALTDGLLVMRYVIGIRL